MLGSYNAREMTLGVLAGAGDFPRMVIEGAKRAGARVVCAGFRGAVRRDIPPLCDAFRRFRVGAVDAPCRFFQEQGVSHVMFAGQIKPACIYTMWPDATARRLLAAMDRRNAHTIFGAACRHAREYGWVVLPSTTFLESALAQPGLLAGPPLSPEQRREALFGLNLARQIADTDIGQSLIVRGNRVVCAEGYKGTNECIREGAGTAASPNMLCKVAKSGHDMRFDVPCIGVDTIRHCLRYHVQRIAVQAHSVIIFQREQVLRLCDKYGISLQAVELPSFPGVSLPHFDSDYDHALFLAHRLAALGVGQSAVVCEGVVIAVEDPAGLAKCLRRAGRYMKRIRFMRFVNRLCRIILRQTSSPPAPLILASLRPLTAEDKLTAQRYGIKFRAPD